MLNIPINMPTFRLPTLRYNRIYWVLFLVIVGAVLFNAVARKKNSFPEDLQVNVKPLRNGEKMINENDIKQALFRAFGNTLEGTELSKLEVERVEKVLEEDPFVSDADAYVDQGNILHVRVRQRAPMLRILDNNGGNYYLDASGVRMPPSKNITARVLVATGNIPAYTSDFREKPQSRLKDLILLTEAILDDAFLAGFIQQIHVNNAGEFILVPLIGDQTIVLGSVRRLEDKFERLKTFYREAMPHAGWRHYKSISLKYKDQIVCKKR